MTAMAYGVILYKQSITYMKHVTDTYRTKTEIFKFANGVDPK